MIKKFDSLEAALAAGFHIDLGNGEYADGGELISRSGYAKLFEAIGGIDQSSVFKLPDLRSK